MKIAPVILALGAGLLLFKNRITQGIDNISITPDNFALDQNATRSANYSSIYMDLDLLIDNPDRIKATVSYITIVVSDSDGNIISRANRQQAFSLTGNPEQNIRLKLKISTGQVVANLIELFSSSSAASFNVNGFFELPAGRINFSKQLSLEA